MQGRWTIWLDGLRILTDEPAPRRDARPVPVVPCDDAAIERVARAIRAKNLHLSLATCFERARDYLRAAGETP